MNEAEEKIKKHLGIIKDTHKNLILYVDNLYHSKSYDSLRDLFKLLGNDEIKLILRILVPNERYEVSMLLKEILNDRKKANME